MVLEPMAYREIDPQNIDEQAKPGEDYWIATGKHLVGLRDDLEILRQIPRSQMASWNSEAMVCQKEDAWYYYSLGEDPFLLPEGEDVYFLEGNYLFSMKGNIQLSRWDKRGRRIWSRDMPSLLTAYACSENRVVLGFLNGDVHIYNSKGDLLQIFQPGGSRVSVIYGLSISYSGDRIALISGLSPQRFLVLEEKNSDYRPVYHSNLQSDFRKPVMMGYQRSGDYFYFRDPQGLALYHYGQEDLSFLELLGEPVDLVHPPRLDCPVVLSRLENRFQLSVFVDTVPYYKREIPGDYARLYQQDLGILLVNDDQLLQLRWSLQ